MRGDRAGRQVSSTTTGQGLRGREGREKSDPKGDPHRSTTID